MNVLTVRVCTKRSTFVYWHKIRVLIAARVAAAQMMQSFGVTVQPLSLCVAHGLGAAHIEMTRDLSLRGRRAEAIPNVTGRGIAHLHRLGSGEEGDCFATYGGSQ